MRGATAWFWGHRDWGTKFEELAIELLASGDLKQGGQGDHKSNGGGGGGAAAASSSAALPPAPCGDPSGRNASENDIPDDVMEALTVIDSVAENMFKVQMSAEQAETAMRALGELLKWKETFFG